ncbi:unnamed protein product, partial [Prorocentrum cordatum]
EGEEDGEEEEEEGEEEGEEEEEEEEDEDELGPWPRPRPRRDQRRGPTGAGRASLATLVAGPCAPRRVGATLKGPRHRNTNKEMHTHRKIPYRFPCFLGIGAVSASEFHRLRASGAVRKQSSYLHADPTA